MLANVGLKREDIYITNIVKYRPPDNRDPLPEEKKEFLPYLQHQLEVIAPKVVVTLGRHSTNCFLPDLQISKSHGQPKRVRLQFRENPDQVLEVVILPLYHPAAALYNGGMAADADRRLRRYSRNHQAITKLVVNRKETNNATRRKYSSTK